MDEPVEPISLEDLQFDTENCNKHTPRGMSMLEESLRQYGAGRGIVTDKDLRIIGGNAVAEVSHDVGLGALVVDSNGEELIAVQRMDLNLNTDPRARSLALIENRIGKLNFDMDREMIDLLTQNGATMADTVLGEDLFLMEVEPSSVYMEATQSKLGGAGAVGDAWELEREVARKNKPIRVKLPPGQYLEFEELIGEAMRRTGAKNTPEVIKEVLSMWVGHMKKGGKREE